MAEKRKTNRVAITALAEMTLPDGDVITSYVANMSRRGIGLYLQKTIDPETQVRVKIMYRIDNGKTKTKEINGRVKWAYPGFFATGISLEGLNEKEHADLLQYIDSVEERDQ